MVGASIGELSLNSHLVQLLIHFTIVLVVFDELDDQSAIRHCEKLTRLADGRKVTGLRRSSA